MKNPTELKDINNRTALIYGRVSTKGQDPRAQIHRCKEYCKKYNVKIEKIFEDKYTGGGDFMERPAMKELFSYVDNNPHKKFIIIFDDIKRLARDVEFHLKIRRTLKTLDIPPFSPNYLFGDTPEDHLMEVLAAVQGDVERKQNRRQVIQKQTARLERGYWAFGAPNGYVQIKNAVHGKILTPKEPDFSLIKEALEGYASGRFHTQQDVCNFLTKSEYKGRGKKIYLTHFKEKLAKQIVYAGYIEYPKWEVSRRKGHHQAAISLETFEKIQKKLNNNANTHYRENNETEFPLRGFLVCNSCGTKLTASFSTSRGKSYGYYHCRKKECKYYGKGVSHEYVHSQFEKILKRLNATQETIDEVKGVFLKKWDERIKDKEKEYDLLKRDLYKSEEDIDAYLDMAKGAMSEEIKKRYEKNANDLIKKQQILREKLKEKPRDKYIVGNALDTVLEFIGDPYKTWLNEDLEGRQLLLKLIFDKNLKYDLKEGVGNVKVSEIVSIFNILEKPSEDGSHYVEMVGIEPTCTEHISQYLHM